MASQFKGLDRWKQLQQNKIGATSALRPDGSNSPVGREYRRQQQDYTLALRTLRRSARKDPGSAKALIELGDQARAEGDIRTGGIRGDGEMRGNAVQRSRDTVRDIGLLEQARADNTAFSREQRGVGRPAAAPTRVGAALDMLEGDMGGDDTGLQRGLDSANRLGVREPERILGGDRNLRYRQTVDTALGAAKSPEEVAALKARSAGFIPAKAFDRRAQWWDRKR